MTRIYDWGPSSLIASLCYDLEIPQLLDKKIQWSDQCKLSPGTRILALIINILMSRDPLYEVKEFFEDIDLQGVFMCNAHPDDFKDKALARALDKLFDANPQIVFNTLVMNTLLKENIKPKVVHSDTTSWSLHGEYNRKDDSKKTIEIEPGHSKDYRPDLKQFKYGLVVTEEKFPLIAQVLSGGMSDKKWTHSLVDTLVTFMKQICTNEIVLVADSALVTKENLKKIVEKKDQGIAFQFISRLPDSFSLEKKLKELAWTTNHWTTVGKISDEKGASTYSYQEFEDIIEGNTYRFLVVHSTKLDSKKRKSFHKKMAKDIESLDKAIKKIDKKEYNSEEEVREAYKTFFEKFNSKYYQLDYTITSFQKKIKRNVQGRHPSNYIPNYEDKYKLSVTRSDLDETAIQQEEKRIGCFILIANANCEFSSKDLLVTYKKQSAPETSFKFIKNPTVVGPIFLKTVKRLESMAYVVMIAFLVYAILERRVRNNLKDEVEPIIISGGKKTNKPTGLKILKSLKRMKVVKVETNDKSVRFIPEDNYKKEHLLNMERVVNLSGYDMNIYLKSRNIERNGC